MFLSARGYEVNIKSGNRYISKQQKRLGIFFKKYENTKITYSLYIYIFMTSIENKDEIKNISMQ